ncbi:MAG: TylF/MycF family methyltransferase [Gammaproteobacteria bacterium]|nr:TylF/MycF family methyltransferase [Gammaproteobacteria bacterium]MBU1645977.1 TylF/MycF family methyltransferase [Gammaproteobacteria bacterium]MBU1972039.1 TylF/MycF family methyltransferase [Gammaproteobacteria bacterium]
MFRRTLNKFLKPAGLELSRPRSRTLEFPVELGESDQSVVRHIIENRLSMTSPERLFATLLACRHVEERGITGDFVECGVWRGGNSLIAAQVFGSQGANGRMVRLFDTFAGMTAPTDDDFTNADSVAARIKFEQSQRETHNEWCYASLDDVRNNFSVAGLLADNVRFVKGDVCQTLSDPANLPDRIAVLRLDTDWYESTKVELEVLWPLLQPGGILMVDDYGHWGGAKKAVDEFFASRQRPFFSYIDATGRIAVKEVPG